MPACHPMPRRPSYPLMALTLAFLASIASAGQIAQTPLIMGQSAEPNVFLTLDDSYSMNVEYVVPEYSLNGRYMHSSTYNTIYYNPSVTYRIPPRYDQNGKLSATPFTTHINHAPMNGLDPGSSTTLDLEEEGMLPIDSSVGRSATKGSGGLPIAESASHFSWNSGSVPALRDGESRFINTLDSPAAIEVTRHGNNCSVRFYINQPHTTKCGMSDPNAQYQDFSVEFTSTGYRKKPKPPPKVAVGYYRYKPDLPGCKQNIQDNSCYEHVAVSSTSGELRADDLLSGTDERQNFANWYSFYRSRLLLTKSGAISSFGELPKNLRIGWQVLNGCSLLESGDSCYNNRLRYFTGRHRGNLFTWLTKMKASGDTPLREAAVRVANYARTPQAWAFNPNPYDANGNTLPTVQQPEYACRRNMHILMTDGEWTGNQYYNNIPGDQTSVALPDGQLYSPIRPYAGNSKARITTLADILFEQWASDLRSDLPNTVPPLIRVPNLNDPKAEYWDPKNDPATWQHINTFTIGLGLSTFLNYPQLPWAGDTYAGPGYQALLKNVDWPPPNVIDEDNRVYDLWHAALNGRGKFYSADNSTQLIDAFTEILTAVEDVQSSGSAPAVGSSEGGDATGKDVYRASFNSQGWIGDLVRNDGDWSAAALLNKRQPDSRKIYMADSASKERLKAFTWSNLDSQQRDALNTNPDTRKTDDLGAKRLAYLRGDRSAEGPEEQDLRIRNGVLGDIINSTPVVVGPPGYAPGFANRIEGSASDYAKFRSDNAKRSATVYVGANDGMLHAFNAKSGEEVFAFVPSAVIPNLPRLASQSYNNIHHQYFVDGTPVTADVYFDGHWHTVLIGTLGAGGRSLFALDITDPQQIRLLWERSANDDDLKALGYTLPRPVVARLYSGQWAVITGNGPSGDVSIAERSASLLILDVATGKLLKQLDTVDPEKGLDNGLSSVGLSDFNEDGVAEYAYAGDTHGNLWRFDLFPKSVYEKSLRNADPFRREGNSSVSVNDFQVSYGGKPLLRTQKNAASDSHRQPFSAAPLLVRHPTGRGYLVIIGSGRFYELGDSQGDPQGSTLYGIWDRHTHGQDTSSAYVEREDKLVQQQWRTSSKNDFGATTSELRMVSRNPVTWYRPGTTVPSGWSTNDNSVKDWGWALNLSDAKSHTGEMVINQAKLRGKLLLVDTLLPGGNPCLGGVSQWLLGLDPYTGGATNFNPFDFNRDGVIDNNDKVDGEIASGFVLPTSGTGATSTSGGTLLTPCLNCSEQGSEGMKYANGLSGRRSWMSVPLDD